MKENQMKTANDKVDKRISNGGFGTLSNADQVRKFKLQGILEIRDKTMNEISKLINVCKRASHAHGYCAIANLRNFLVNTRVISFLLRNSSFYKTSSSKNKFVSSNFSK